MNRVAVTMRHGMLDSEGASQELELIQKQIEEIVKTLPFHAGIEEGT
jgi:phosphoribosylformylglycinamidine (FGAM) synthase PurS component